MLDLTTIRLAAALAIALAAFWTLPRNARYGFLSLASILLLATLEPVTVVVFLAWSLAFHAVCSRPGWKGASRWGSVLVGGILVYLALTKYVPPLVSAESYVVPLGVSYFTFKLIHYQIECARGNIRHRSLQRFLCWVFLLPTFTAGPIERFDHFLDNLEVRWSLTSSVEGATRIVHGLIKKFVLADGLTFVLSAYREEVRAAGDVSEVPVATAWACCALSYLYIYMDFSAYSDLAIGTSRLFGIRILENFNWPLIARSIGDFWTRWHMTLAGWCRSYVYMPTIGLTRNPYLAVYSTFIAIGLWHAGTASYLCWGLYHATGVVVFQTWRRVQRTQGWTFTEHPLWRPVGPVLTFLFVSGSFAFTVTAARGGAYTGLRLLAHMLFIDLPA